MYASNAHAAIDAVVGHFNLRAIVDATREEVDRKRDVLIGRIRVAAEKEAAAYRAIRQAHCRRLAERAATQRKLRELASERILAEDAARAALNAAQAVSPASRTELSDRLYQPIRSREQVAHDMFNRNVRARERASARASRNAFSQAYRYRRRVAFTERLRRQRMAIGSSDIAAYLVNLE
jgi:hypothetical protein